jgi:cytochrome oxidase assembly protein ShyY1
VRLRRLVPSTSLPLLLAVMLSVVLGLGTWSLARCSWPTAGDPLGRTEPNRTAATEREEQARTWAWRVWVGSLLLLALWLTHRSPIR